MRNGWKDQAVVENSVEDPLLLFKTGCFFLQAEKV
jgi:hypothetical protein